MTIKTILDNHAAWLRDEAGAQRADLRNADLRYADLRYANLSDANLRYANLRYANLRYADLRYADLRYADLRDANLRDADLSDANLSGADLSDANLSDADLSGADLWGVVGEMHRIKSGQIEDWSFTYTTTYLQIGCQCHPIADWWAFDDARIEAMDPNALAFWGKWKSWFMDLIERSPAK